jgi:hypothetical protein
VFVKLIIGWYQGLCITVRWNGALSSKLMVQSGVRQGGVLSPALFNLYVDCFLKRLRKSDLGCHLKQLYIGCIMYADDLILLSSSVIELQKMLDICGEIATELDLKFNCAKCKCLVIGCMKNVKRANLLISGNVIQWTDSIKYLGLVIISDSHFSVDFTETRRKYFIALNTVLNKTKHASDLSKLYIIESHCLPLLMYGVEALNLPNLQSGSLGCWWNAVFRKLFSFNIWESVKLLTYWLKRLDMHHMIIKRRLLFIKRLENCNNSLIINVLNIFKTSPECAKLFKMCNADLSSSFRQIKTAIASKFSELCERQQ